jgi:hypothetical protein
MRKETRKYLFEALLFLLIFSLINYGFIYIFKKERLKNSRTGTIDHQFHEVEKKINVLAMGDSHVATGFDPRVFKNAFNFSLYGENYIYNYYKLKYILQRNPQVRVVILPIDLHSFSSWRADRFLFDFYWVKYLNYWEVGWYKKEVLKFLSKYINGKFFPYKGEFETVFHLPPQMERNRKVPLPKIFQGFILKTENFHQNRNERARQRVSLHFYKHYHLDDELVHYFKKIIVLCSQKKRILVLVKFPVSKIYFQYASKKIPVDIIYKKVQSIIQPYRNVRVLDYQKLFFENDGIYFDDPDHLNQKGAKVLSEKIREELIRLNMIPRE